MKVLYLPPRVAAMLEGVLRHCTDMTIKRQMTDSHGQSEIGFAFSHLLGFRLLPRLKPMHSQRLAVVEDGAAELYPHLKEVLGKPINWEVIRRQYDMMIKDAAALKTGTADADALLQRFTRSNLQHPTYQGLCELGLFFCPDQCLIGKRTFKKARKLQACQCDSDEKIDRTSVWRAMLVQQMLPGSSSRFMDSQPPLLLPLALISWPLPNLDLVPAVLFLASRSSDLATVLVLRLFSYQCSS